MAAAVVGSASPISSPRLPSPPPFPEVQIGPKSPGMPAISSSGMPDIDSTAKLDQGAMRRIRPGTKAAQFAGPPLVPLSDLDSPFQLQEHLKALHYHHTRSPTDPKMTTPITRETALTIATPPPNVDRSLWLYELCRLLVQKANTVCVSFFREDPPCSAATCPEMRASEWQYLCAVHEPPKSCCAIDYCCHTLEWAADTLTSTRFFPSRLTLGSEANGGSQGGVRQLTNIMRRVYRIFAHAWFQHRGVFWHLEGDEGLYILFKTVCDVYSLIPEENYTIPPEAEGLPAKVESKEEMKGVQREETADKAEPSNEEKLSVSTSATARRQHKHSPSMGSSVATIQEGDEEGQDYENATRKEDIPPASAIESPRQPETDTGSAPNIIDILEPQSSVADGKPHLTHEVKDQSGQEPTEGGAESQVTSKEVSDEGSTVTEGSTTASLPPMPLLKVEEHEVNTD